jgi:hypothetical protein
MYALYVVMWISDAYADGKNTHARYEWYKIHVVTSEKTTFFMREVVSAEVCKGFLGHLNALEEAYWK